jgi:hypothetical protein
VSILPDSTWTIPADGDPLEKILGTNKRPPSMLSLSTLEVFFTWVVAAITLIGLGSLLLSRFTKNFFLADAFWMGLAISVALLEIWNIVFPVTASITLFLFCAGILGLALNRFSLLTSWCTAWQRSRWLLLLGIAFTLLLALRSCAPCEHYDTGLYGAPVVRWMQTYPAVPGLANLHGRFGFNSSVFLCIAALGQGPWKNLGFHLFTGFMLSAMWVTLLPACARVIGRLPTSPANWFYSILALPAFFWTVRSRIVGTQTDEPATVVCLIAAGILFEHFCQEDGRDQPKTHTSRLILATTLFSLAVAFKLSTIVFALLAWCFAFRGIWLLGRSARQRTKYLFATLALSSLILLPWCARGIILSGYPFYPATVVAFPVAWKVPLSAARWYALGVQSWGRIPDTPFRDTQGIHWLGGWLNHALRNRPSFQVPVAISLAGLFVALISRFRKKHHPACPWLSLLFPSIVGIIFWFVASPDLRFAQFAIWTMAATLGVWGIVSLDLQLHRSHTNLVLAALVLSSIWCLISFGWNEPLLALRGVQQPPPLPKPALILQHTLSGLAVYVPAQGDQCWDAPLPCTAYFDQSLRLRNSSSLRWGFTSEGRAAEFSDFMISHRCNSIGAAVILPLEHSF